jgi:hypothetical protein
MNIHKKISLLSGDLHKSQYWTQNFSMSRSWFIPRSRSCLNFESWFWSHSWRSNCFKSK